MPNQKILYITTEMSPYQEESSIANMVNKMALKMYREGNDVRVFMPKFGMISDRKFQLHEVIRLSGMNIIINDLDQPLIIKVASLPGERLQVYFIDNEEYFKRKFFYKNEVNEAFEDNGERAIFFARGVIETIKKLNWVPDVIHFNGWMSSLIPIYMNTYYKSDYYFKNTLKVISVFNEEKIDLEKDFVKKLKFDGVSIPNNQISNSHSILIKSFDYADLIIKGDEFLVKNLDEAFQNSKSQKSDYIDPDLVQSVYTNSF